MFDYSFPLHPQAATPPALSSPVISPQQASLMTSRRSTPQTLRHSTSGRGFTRARTSLLVSWAAHLLKSERESVRERMVNEMLSLLLLIQLLFTSQQELLRDISTTTTARPRRRSEPRARASGGVCRWTRGRRSWARSCRRVIWCLRRCRAVRCGAQQTGGKDWTDWKIISCCCWNMEVQNVSNIFCVTVNKF